MEDREGRRPQKPCGAQSGDGCAGPAVAAQAAQGR